MERTFICVLNWIPRIANILLLVEKLHKQILHYFEFASCNKPIDKDNNPVLMEPKSKYKGVMILQLNNGHISGEGTEEKLMILIIK